MKKIHALGLRQRFRLIAVLLGACLIHIAPVHGAERPSVAGAYALTKGTNEFGLWGGGSPDSFDFIGTVEDRELLLFGLRYGRVLGAWESVSLEYTLDIIPAAVVFEPDSVRRGSSTIYGAGLSPLGFKLNIGQESWIKPFLAAAVGFLYFEKDIPVPRSSRFNFTPELGLGVQFFLAPKRALTLGYKWHHMSNANTGRSNPGMDSHVFYAGFSFFTP
jgi:opacity protein-like surface antigen